MYVTLERWTVGELEKLHVVWNIHPENGGSAKVAKQNEANMGVDPKRLCDNIKILICLTLKAFAITSRTSAPLEVSCPMLVSQSNRGA